MNVQRTRFHNLWVKRVNFNGVSKRLGVINIFIYLFIFFLHSCFFKGFLIRSIWPRNSALKSTTAPCQSRSSNNGSEAYPTFSRFPEAETQNQMQLSTIHRTPLRTEVLPPSAGDTVSVFLVLPTEQYDLSMLKTLKVILLRSFRGA